MRSARAVAILFSIAGVSSGAGCRHAPHTAASLAPAGGPVEEYCWWAVFRTVLPPDTVAVHFVSAFATVGFTNARWTHIADTAWASAGPTVLSGRGGRTYDTRVVAYRRGDSTHFRQFVGIQPAPGVAGDSAESSGIRIALCGEMGAAAAVHGTSAPQPDGEETLPIWKRRQ